MEVQYDINVVNPYITVVINGVSVLLDQEEFVNKANRMWLPRADVLKVVSYCQRHNIRWTPKRTQLLMMGSKGNLEDRAYKRYLKLLRRIEYEMRCRHTGQLIRIGLGNDIVPERYY